ncbi:hypothetical protein GOV12_00720 [Candidatus Pacearchaeota archaeon]|nr:hypothetical protein [Candidatus Pacearchaeota archaeon]
MKGLDFDVRDIGELRAKTRATQSPDYLLNLNSDYVLTLDNMLDDVSGYWDILNQAKTAHVDGTFERAEQAFLGLEEVTVNREVPAITFINRLLSGLDPSLIIASYSLTLNKAPSVELQRRIQDINIEMQKREDIIFNRYNEKGLIVDRLQEDLNAAMFELSEVIPITELPEFSNLDDIRRCKGLIETIMVYSVNPNGSFVVKDKYKQQIRGEVEENGFTSAQLTNDSWVGEFSRNQSLSETGELIYLVRNPSRHSDPSKLHDQGIHRIMKDFGKEAFKKCPENPGVGEGE